MRLVIQRVSQASVTVNSNCVGRINNGLMILVGITHNDNEQKVRALAQKVVNLRVFNDCHDKMNLSIIDIKGSILAISQFTLYADASKGNRPSYVAAASAELAQPLYELFIAELRLRGVTVSCGIFGADMKVAIVNDGPVTILLDK